MLDALRAYEQQAVPRLPSSGLLRWLGTQAYLHRLLHALGFEHHFFYTSGGYSLGQWLIAHGAGGQPIAGAVKVSGGAPIGQLHAGEVVELSVNDTQSLVAMLIALHDRLHQEGLHAVPVGELMRDASTQT